jgi:PIN domain nuclease of toxin-antitoxin system
MRVLLDTHTFIWFIMDDPALGPQAAELIKNPDNEVLVSIAAAWEIAIKMSLNKLNMKAPFDQLFPAQLQHNNFSLLPIEIPHLARITSLPWHHRDPFDRLMIAQSLVEDMPILSRDSNFDAYAVERLW